MGKRIFLCWLLLCGLLSGPVALAGGGSGDVEETLQGYWETENYGTRIEIDGDRLVILWRNRPVLETDFTLAEEGDDWVVRLARTGLRYRDAASDYAAVTDCRLREGKLCLCQKFVITGDSREVLGKTTNSRYGNVTVITGEALPRLSGLWRTADGVYEMKIDQGTLTWRCQGSEWAAPEAVAVVLPRDGEGPDDFCIVNRDPAEEFVCDLLPFRHEAGALITRPVVFDGSAPEIVFRKVG